LEVVDNSNQGNDNIIEMEKERVLLFLEQLKDLVFMGRINSSDAETLLGDLVDADKEEAENDLEEIIFEAMAEIHHLDRDICVGMVSNQ
jgi:diphthamide biosynthesis methyltransferase